MAGDMMNTFNNVFTLPMRGIPKRTSYPSVRNALDNVAHPVRTARDIAQKMKNVIKKPKMSESERQNRVDSYKLRNEMYKDLYKK